MDRSCKGLRNIINTFSHAAATIRANEAAAAAEEGTDASQNQNSGQEGDDEEQ